MNIIQNPLSMEGLCEVLGSERVVQWREEGAGHMGALQIKGVTWSDAEKILIALKMANNFNMTWATGPALATETFKNQVPPAAAKAAEKSEKNIKKAVEKFHEQSQEQAPITKIVESAKPATKVLEINPAGYTYEEIADLEPVEEITDFDPEPTPKPKPAANGNIPEEVKAAQQFKQVFQYWQDKHWTEEEMIKEAERLASLVDDEGDSMFPIIARIPNIPDRIKRYMLAAV